MERDMFVETDNIVNLFTPLCVIDSDYNQEDAYYSAMDILLLRFDRYISSKTSSDNAFDRFQTLLDVFYCEGTGLKERVEKIVEMDVKLEQKWALAELEFMKVESVKHVPSFKGPVFH